MEMFGEKVSYLAHLVCLVIKVEMSPLDEFQLLLSSEQTVRLACYCCAYVSPFGVAKGAAYMSMRNGMSER